MTQAPDGGPGKLSPAVMLSDTIGRVAVVEQRVSQLGADISEIGAMTHDVKEGMAGVERSLRDLNMRVVALAGADEDDEEEEEDDETALVDWSSLDRAGALREWDRLYQWLDTWLVPTYEISVEYLGCCWTYHPVVREELSWLRVTWAQAYRRPRASGAAAGEWHTRWLPTTLDRIRQQMRRRGCSGGRHVTPDGRDHILPEEYRKIESYELATMRTWLDDGRLAHIDSLL